MHAVYYGTLLLAVFEEQATAISLVEYAMGMGLGCVSVPTEYAEHVIKGGILTSLECHSILKFKGLL